MLLGDMLLSVLGEEELVQAGNWVCVLWDGRWESDRCNMPQRLVLRVRRVVAAAAGESTLSSPPTTALLQWVGGAFGACCCCCYYTKVPLGRWWLWPGVGKLVV